MEKDTPQTVTLHITQDDQTPKTVTLEIRQVTTLTNYRGLPPVKPKPLDANARHLACISDMGHTPDYDSES